MPAQDPLPKPGRHKIIRRRCHSDKVGNGPQRDPPIEFAKKSVPSNEHDPGNGPGSFGMVGRVGGGMETDDPRLGVSGAQSFKSLGMPDMIVSMSFSDKSPLKPKPDLTLPSFHIKTVTSASAEIS